MTDNAIFIGWGNSVRNRESQATAVFDEANNYWHKLQDTGEIEGYDVFMLEPHGGDLTGFAVLRGDAGKLAAVHASDDFQQLVAKATLVVEGLGVVNATMNNAAAEQIGAYASMAAAMT